MKRMVHPAVEFGQMASADWVHCARLGSIHGGLQVSDRAEDTAANALSGHFGEEVLDRVEPGSRGRGEVESPARMTRQPGQHFGMLMSGIVVEDDVDRQAGCHLALGGVEKSKEFEIPVALHAAGRITVPWSTLSAPNGMVVPCRL